MFLIFGTAHREPLLLMFSIRSQFIVSDPNFPVLFLVHSCTNWRWSLTIFLRIHFISIETIFDPRFVLMILFLVFFYFRFVCFLLFFFSLKTHISRHQFLVFSFRRSQFSSIGCLNITIISDEHRVYFFECFYATYGLVYCTLWKMFKLIHLNIVLSRATQLYIAQAQKHSRSRWNNERERERTMNLFQWLSNTCYENEEIVSLFL